MTKNENEKEIYWMWKATEEEERIKMTKLKYRLQVDLHQQDDVAKILFINTINLYTKTHTISEHSCAKLCTSCFLYMRKCIEKGTRS